MDSEEELDLEGLKIKNQEIVNELEKLQRTIQELQTLAFGPDEWYNDDDVGGEDENN